MLGSYFKDLDITRPYPSILKVTICMCVHVCACVCVCVHVWEWAYGVVVSMFDFHCSDRGSNPGRGGKIS